MLGIDIIPAQPPKGVSTIQGNFLSQTVQEQVKFFLRNPNLGRLRGQESLVASNGQEQILTGNSEGGSQFHTESDQRVEAGAPSLSTIIGTDWMRQNDDESAGERVVDVVLSDMSEIWPQTEGFWKRSLSNPYYRMMNTSGMSFRDHAGSMVISKDWWIP